MMFRKLHFTLAGSLLTMLTLGGLPERFAFAQEGESELTCVGPLISDQIPMTATAGYPLGSFSFKVGGNIDPKTIEVNIKGQTAKLTSVFIGEGIYQVRGAILYPIQYGFVSIKVSAVVPGGKCRGTSSWMVRIN